VGGAVPLPGGSSGLGTAEAAQGEQHWGQGARLCHLAAALLQNGLFSHFPRLCLQLKVIGTNAPSNHGADAYIAALSFFIRPSYCSVLHWVWRSLRL